MAQSQLLRQRSQVNLSLDEWIAELFKTT